MHHSPVGTMKSLLLAVALFGASLAACQGETRTYTTSGVAVSGASSDARWESALDAVGSGKLGAEAMEMLGEYKGTFAVDRPTSLSGLPADAKTLSLTDSADVRAVLLLPDEAAASKLLIEKGARIIVLHSKVAPSLDRDRSVLSRLYNHDQLEYFSLVRVTADLFVYEVRERPVVFPPQLAAISTQYLRARLKGLRPQNFPDVASDTGNWAFLASVRGQGQELAFAFSRDVKLTDALDELAVDLEKVHRRNVEVQGTPPLARHIDDLSIELQRVVERAYVEPRDEAALEDLFEMGIDGAYMMTADKKERGALPGSVSYTRALRSADSFLREAAEVGGMTEKRPWRDGASWLEIFRTIHYRELAGGGGIAVLYRGVAPVPIEQVTLARTRESILASADWYLNNLQPDGRVVYKFWPAENRYSDEYNIVRHTLATWNLAQAWQLDPKPEYVEGSRRALGYTNRFLAEKEGPEGTMAFYLHQDNIKLGTNVVNILGILELARATEDTQYDELLRKLGRFSKWMQEPSGTFRGYDVPEGHPYFGQKNDIVPGEAALALIGLADYFDDDSWIEGLPKFWEYYRPWFDSRVAKRDNNQPWPHLIYTNETRLDLVQFGPWTVMAANAYHRRTGNADVAKFGLEIARWMIASYEWDENRTPWPDYLGGYYKLPGELPAMQAFCYAEGTAAAYDLALRMAPDQAPYFEKATREAVRFGLQMQFDELSDYPFARPMQVRGGTRYAMNETKVRIDYVYHAQSAAWQYYHAALKDPALPAAVRDGPGRFKVEALVDGVPPTPSPTPAPVALPPEASGDRAEAGEEGGE
jgi:hypothetical protein